MERLTETYRNSDGTGISKKSLVIEEGLKKGFPSGYCSSIVTKLADYEDAEEQGLLLKPKVALNSFVYWDSGYWGVIPYKVCMMNHVDNDLAQ